MSAIFQCCAQTNEGSGQGNEGPLCLLGGAVREQVVGKKLVGPSWSTQVGRTGCEKACSRREYERAEEVVGAGRILAAHLGSSSGKPCCIIHGPTIHPANHHHCPLNHHHFIIITQSHSNCHQNPLTLHVITITIETAIMVDQKSYFRGEHLLTYIITICVAPIVKICRTSLLPPNHIIGMLLQAGWSTGRPISVSFLICT